MLSNIRVVLGKGGSVLNIDFRDMELKLGSWKLGGVEKICEKVYT